MPKNNSPANLPFSQVKKVPLSQAIQQVNKAAGSPSSEVMVQKALAFQSGHSPKQVANKK